MMSRLPIGVQRHYGRSMLEPQYKVLERVAGPLILGGTGNRDQTEPCSVQLDPVSQAFYYSPRQCYQLEMEHFRHMILLTALDIYQPSN